MKIVKEVIVAPRLKLLPFGVVLDESADLHCNDRGSCNNKTNPELALAKKRNTTNYGVAREAIARKIIGLCKEDTATILADISTKLMTLARKDEPLKFLEENWTRDELPHSEMTVHGDHVNIAVTPLGALF